MDELAHSVKLDPLEFRLKNAKDERLRAVIVAAADKFDWKGRQKSAGRGFGIAAGFEKGGYVATCAEVAVDRRPARVKVLRAVIAFECGAVVNPEHLRNQVEGAVVMGLGRRAVRGDRVRGRQDRQQSPVALPRAALRGYAGDRERAAGSQGSGVGRRRGDADRGDRAGHRQRHLRCDRETDSQIAV